MSYKSLIIANPNAGHGLLKKNWSKLSYLFGEKIKKFEVEFTKAPKDATHLTRKALKEGYEMIIGIGGDGTLNECLNGFFEKEKAINPKAVLGVLPYGRGSDLARSLGLSRDPEIAINHLSGKKFRSLDVGKVSFKEKGRRQVHYFMNNAYLGFGEAVDHYSNECPRALGATGCYFYGYLRAIFAYKPFVIEYEIDGKKMDAEIMNFTAANGPFYGAGMKAAPLAKTDDGLLDVVLIKKTSYLKMTIQTPKFYTGGFLGDDNVEHYQCKSVTVRPKKTGKKVVIEMDGDPLARLPATFEIVPRAVRFKY